MPPETTQTPNYIDNEPAASSSADDLLHMRRLLPSTKLQPAKDSVSIVYRFKKLLSVSCGSLIPPVKLVTSQLTIFEQENFLES